MLKINIQKNSQMGMIKTKYDRGFALLFSVLISSLLLSIGLSIFNIALKELALSTASARSVNAFYAADSGRECGIYWDYKIGEIPNLFGKTRGTITCNGSDQDIDGNYSNDNKRVDIGVSIIYIDKDTDGNDNTDGPNYEVRFVKTVSNNGLQASTTITATGHDSGSGDRAERAIKQDY